jgi:hypothetical protein
MEPGGLAVQCPACPHSGINLPENWEQVDVSLKLIFNVYISICNLCWQIRFLYALFLTLDTNFHLKNCLQSSEAGDPGFHNHSLDVRSTTLLVRQNVRSHCV